MALFKIHKGTGAFPAKAVEGYCYFNSSTGRFAIDIADASSGATMGTHRLLINPDAIVNITRSGNTFTATQVNGGTFTFTQTDTKNTAGSTDSSSKLFLIGATSQATNPQTYSQDTAYVGTDGCLYSNSTKVSVEGHTHSYVPTSRTVNGKALSGNITLNYTDVGAAAASHGTHVTYGTSASALGTSSAGSSTSVSRSDHVHALPALTSCTGTLSVAKGGTGATDAAAARTNLGITPANIGAAASSHGTHVTYGTTAKALGTSSAGTASSVSRSDHVHALPALTSCTGTLTIAKGGTGKTTNYEAFHALTFHGNATNANTALKRGIYCHSTNCTNTAQSSSYGAIETIICNDIAEGVAIGGTTSSSWVWQWGYCTNTVNPYIRNSINAEAFSTWRKVWLEGDSITGAVWNDYAEYRESDCEEFGRVLMENGDDTLSITTDRLQPFAGISSDTWGFCQGETEKAKTPIAVAGRVLAYPYQNRDNYKPGDCVCSAPNGTVDIMTREEVVMYPDRIIGTVSCVPNYETWGSGDRDPVQVNGRIWIKVK